MNSKIKNILQKTIYLKDIKCLFCDCELDRETRYCVCEKCLSKLPFLKGKVCQKCGEPIQSLAEFCMHCKNHVDRGFDKARAVFLYKDEIRNAIINFKYFGNKYYAEYFSKFMLDCYIKSDMNCDVIIPAPISERSLKIRGFNQAELLCSAFKDYGLNVDENCVKKVLETENQAKLNYKDRQTNLINAFKVLDKSKIKNKNVLIVDDIYTTGATCSEIAETLKKSGAKNVDVITLCHEMPENQKN